MNGEGLSGRDGVSTTVNGEELWGKDGVSRTVNGEDLVTLRPVHVKLGYDTL